MSAENTTTEAVAVA